MENDTLKEFKKNACFRIEEGQRMIRIAFAKVQEEKLWELPGKNGMALGNQILHICGNMNQYVVSSLGAKPDNRKRDMEFSAKEGYNRVELLKKLDKTVSDSIKIIEAASELQYKKIYKVQGFELSGIGVVFHAVEHFSYHVGQIAFWVKQLTQSDLGFYKNFDLNHLNN